MKGEDRCHCTVLRYGRETAILSMTAGQSVNVEANRKGWERAELMTELASG